MIFFLFSSGLQIEFNIKLPHLKLFSLTEHFSIKLLVYKFIWLNLSLGLNIFGFIQIVYYSFNQPKICCSRNHCKMSKYTVKPLITNTSEEFINLFKKFIKNSPMINTISKLTVRANEQLG